MSHFNVEWDPKSVIFNEIMLFAIKSRFYTMLFMIFEEKHKSVSIEPIFLKSVYTVLINYK